MALIVFRLRDVTFWIIIFALLYFSKAESETSSETALKKPTTETNVFNFFRLFIMRMVYGFASMFGLGEFLEDFAGGIFAPPSTDYDGFDYGSDDDYKEYTDYDY
ncbi:hypothetical protein PGB90_004304 [Kerria lacca]